MWILLFGLTSGFLATSWANTHQGVRIRSCSYVGVYQIQGTDRYTLGFSEAQELCEHLGATLASEDQMNTAYVKGFQTCRYGWTSNGNIGILRHKANHLCAGNQTGHIIINATESQYDAYCYDGTDLSVKNCTLAKNLDTSAPSTVPASPHTADTERPSDGSEGGDFRLAPTASSSWLYTEAEEITVPSSENKRNGSLQDTTEATQHGRGPVAEGPTKALPWTRHPAGTTAFITRGDGGGSGMGDATVKEMPDFSSEDGPHMHGEATDGSDEEDTVSEALSPTESPKWPLGADKGPSAEDKGNNGARNWLIIVCVIVAVAAILLVCAAVATRKRWCGRQQTLMITSKSSAEGNGAATSATSSRAQEREQEMVTLMNKEKIQENGNPEEFTVITLEESPEKKEQA